MSIVFALRQLGLALAETCNYSQPVTVEIGYSNPTTLVQVLKKQNKTPGCMEKVVWLSKNSTEVSSGSYGKKIREGQDRQRDRVKIIQQKRWQKNKTVTWSKYRKLNRRPDNQNETGNDKTQWLQKKHFKKWHMPKDGYLFFTIKQPPSSSSAVLVNH